MTDLKRLLFSPYLFYNLGFFAFLYFLGITSFCNRMESMDDLFFYLQAKEHGAINSLFVFDYNTRYLSFLVYNIAFSGISDFESMPVAIFLYHGVFFGLLIVSIFQFIGKTSKVLGLVLNGHQKIVLCFSLAMGIFFGAPQLIDNWFWLIASTIYTLPLIFLFFGFSIFIQKNTGALAYTFMLFCFLFIGGSLETWAISIAFVILSLFAMSFFYNRLSYLRMKSIITLVPLLFFFVPNFFLGGISQRIEMEQSYYSEYIGFTDFLNSFLGVNKLFVLGGFLVCFLIGHSTDRLKTSKGILLSMLKWNGFILCMVFCITMFPLFYVFEDWGPARAWLPFHFFLIMSLGFWTFIVGNRVNVKIKTHRGHQILGFGILSLFLCLIIRHQNKLFYFAQTHDQRINELCTLRENNFKGVYYFSSLPSAVYGVGLQLEEDSLSCRNEQLCKVLQLDFNIVSIKD